MTFEELIKESENEWEQLQSSENCCVFVGMATCGRSAGALEVLESLRADLEAHHVDARVTQVGCMGWCSVEPLVGIRTARNGLVYYGNVTTDTVGELVKDCILKAESRPDLALFRVDEARNDGIPSISDLPVFKPQRRVALRNCGHINPGEIRHYVARGGYRGLAKALKMRPEAVIEEVRMSGLRGCGGAGFPTADKWRLCLEASEQEKCVVCNAAESDPKAFKDRMLLEGDPHAVLEGILICAYAVRARRGYVYVNPRYELAVSYLQTALKQLETHHLTGEKILGSDFSFRLEIKNSGEGLVSGEESALLSHLQGEPLMACARPPFPAVEGMEGMPTVVNNVETMAQVSAILAKGAGWYAGFGIGAGKGTKVLSLEGQVVNRGIVEVPLGTTLRQVIHGMGGVPEDDSEIKAVQVGGSAGGWIKPEDLDTVINYEDLEAAGTMMGSGSVFAAASDSCAVDLALESLALISSEACGRCVFGREGTRQMAEILSDITSGRGRQDDIDLLLTLGQGMRLGSLCGLGKAAPNPVLSTIRHFRTEYEAHIKEKTCPSEVCRQLNE